MARARAALAASSVVAFSFGVACQPQDIYLFDAAPQTTRVDAGASPSEPRPEPAPPEPAPPEPAPTYPPVEAPVDAGPEREPPACASEACETCVARNSCTTLTATLFCHPATARCSVQCDPDAPARTVGNCPVAEQCDPRIGLCVECIVDADCGGTSPACDRTSGTCVACNSDTDCPAGSGLCLREEHRCVQCLVDTDCRIGDDSDVCLPGLLRCGECLVDADCTEQDKPFCSTENECEDERE
jgi:hypothetical protein